MEGRKGHGPVGRKSKVSAAVHLDSLHVSFMTKATKRHALFFLAKNKPEPRS